jgi:hypothetical protein
MLISEQRSGFQQFLTSIFRIHEHACQTPSDGLSKNHISSETYLPIRVPGRPTYHNLKSHSLQLFPESDTVVKTYITDSFRHRIFSVSGLMLETCHNSLKYYHVLSDYRRGLVGNWFIELLHLISASKDYAPTVLHTSQITIELTKFPEPGTVFTSRCLVAASYGGHSPSSGFSNCPRLQLPTSNSNSSQRRTAAAH